MILVAPMCATFSPETVRGSHVVLGCRRLYLSQVLSAGPMHPSGNGKGLGFTGLRGLRGLALYVGLEGFTDPTSNDVIGAFPQVLHKCYLLF